MPAVYKIIWCRPCLLHKADTLSQSHCILQVVQNAPCELLFHISFPVTVIVSKEQAVYEVGKGGQYRG